MSGIFKVPKGVTTVTVGPILGGSGGSSAAGITHVPSHLIADSTLGGHHISNSNTFQNFVDHVIEGQTLFVEHRLPGSYLLGDDTIDAVKKILINKMLDEMVKAKCIEFTRMENLETNEYIFRSRVHVLPDDKVRLIREIKDARKTT
jgi:hypothetical protein